MSALPVALLWQTLANQPAGTTILMVDLTIEEYERLGSVIARECCGLELDNSARSQQQRVNIAIAVIDELNTIQEQRRDAAADEWEHGAFWWSTIEGDVDGIDQSIE